MVNIYHDLNQQEQQALDEMRAWALAQGTPGEHLIGQLAIAQRIVDSGKIGAGDTWKMNAVGVLFGDAIKHTIGDKLTWVVAEDEVGRAYALNWKNTEALVYPLSAIKARLQAAEPVHLQALYDEYCALFPAQRY